MPGDNKTQIIVALLVFVGGLTVAVVNNWDKLLGTDKTKPNAVQAPILIQSGSNNSQITGSNNTVNSGNITHNDFRGVDESNRLPPTASVKIDIQKILLNGIRSFHAAQFKSARSDFETVLRHAETEKNERLAFTAKSNLLALDIVEGNSKASALFRELSQNPHRNSPSNPSLALVHLTANDIKTIYFIGPDGKFDPEVTFVQAFYADTGELAQKVRMGFPSKSVNWIKGDAGGIMISLTFSGENICIINSVKDENGVSDDYSFSNKRVPCPN